MSTTVEMLGVDQIVKVMTEFNVALSRHEATINALNVFPVPDGDTGTNMAATTSSVIAAIEGLEGEPTTAAVGRAISTGSLMGARGNSGVILCQILRGFAKVMGDLDLLGPSEVAAGLCEGSTAANGAVLRPAAGTILTVAEVAAGAATESVRRKDTLSELVRAVRTAAVDGLAHTPEQLPVLAQAGVVDAGGAGLLCFYDALVAVVSGDSMPESLELPNDVLVRLVSGTRPKTTAHGEPADEAEFRYEVMYLLEAPDLSIEAFKQAWGAIGDSIVVVGGEGLHNCHIHTNDIGAAIEAALDVGRPREIRVTDLVEQVEEERWVRDHHFDDEPGTPVGPPPVTSIVTVGNGAGIRRVFRSLGVDCVVAGGQSMNPSTAEILRMIEAAPGGEVVVLPNNKNIYPVAAQASELSSKAVRVVPTAGIPEGFAALMGYDPGATAEQNAEEMAAAADRVVAGEVTQAVRATTSEKGEVAEGDFIGLSRSGIESIGSDVVEATTGLLDALLLPEHEIVTLIEGASVSPGDSRRVTEWLADHRPDVTVERIDGDQPLYQFFISIE